MYPAPIDLSKFRRNDIDPEDSRKRSLERIAQWKQAQEDLERICEELGIPVPEMICQAANKAEVPQDLMLLMVTEMGLFNIADKRIDGVTSVRLCEALAKAYKVHFKPEWENYKVNCSCANINGHREITVCLGNRRIATLK